MGYLIDTNILSELRKADRANPGVLAWFQNIKTEEIYLSALVLGEIRHGIELIRRRDKEQAEALESWLNLVVESGGNRILSVDTSVSDCWGRLGVPGPIPVIDGLLAATALQHDLVLVTRNVKDIETTGVKLLNPFTPLEI